MVDYFVRTSDQSTAGETGPEITGSQFALTMPRLFARASIAATCSTNCSLYCSLPSSMLRSDPAAAAVTSDELTPMDRILGCSWMQARGGRTIAACTVPDARQQNASCPSAWSRCPSSTWVTNASFEMLNSPLILILDLVDDACVARSRYSTKSANDSGVDEDVVVMIGSAPIATAMSITSKGPPAGISVCVVKHETMFARQ